MQEHGFVAFALGAVFNEARATALDLNAATGLLLDVLHIRTALADDLRAQIETGDRFEVDGDALVWPFTLCVKLVGSLAFQFRKMIAYTSILISLYWLRFTPFESSFVNEGRKLLLHQVVDQLHGLVETFFAYAGHMKVKRGVLRCDQQLFTGTQ